ncbi:TonB-dependent siderophore receptor [Pseudomonas fragi]|jgi:outer-membrane receptor for ferric coprogen and ferric-rhodotorulic acid|uniref:TonB-dependent siderophore receptor n=1 Tax=Pseudomonas fragi TaxID=296 RepID=UPI000B4C2FFE|nr:TonB-dependent siderophore receptor [Pseudomonas fragi]ASC88346.1 TonB-dependent siderophore receptor [Pseudomonas fragi]
MLTSYKPLTLAIHLIVASAAGVACAATAQAQTAAVQTYDIPAGPLSSALNRFAQQAGVAIIFQSSNLEGLSTPGLQGAYNEQGGFDALLRGSGYTVVKSANGYRLDALPAAGGALELGATQVSANQLGTITEGSGSYTPGSIATATRMVLTPKETPQSISVVTRQAMDDFGMNSIDDVMRHTPGITVATYDSDRTSYYSRGFAIKNFQYDGIPILQDPQYSAGHTLTDTAIYDRVEILKGATGLLTGAGGPGGTINMVRKKPTREFKAHIDVGAGSWENYRSEIDVSGPLTESGNVRGRAVAAYQDKHSFMDHYKRDSEVYYGILEVDLTPDTLLTLGADYQDNNPTGSSWSGSASLFNSAGERISTPRSFNNGTKWSSWKQYTRTVFSTLEHNFDNGWVVKGQYNHQINGYNAPLGALLDPNVTTGLAPILARKYTGEYVSDSGDLFATGPFSLLGREHELVVGGSISRSHWTGKDYTNADMVNNAYDYYNWKGEALEPDWRNVTSYNDETTRQVGTYMTGRFSLTDDLKLMLGTRVADYNVTGTSQAKDTGKVLPYAALIYDITPNISAYTSYTQIFLPQTYYRDRNNKMLEPDEGTNYELGLKGEFYDGRLNSSLAYFEVHQDNRPEADMAYNGNPTNPEIDYAYKGIKATTKGYEAEISGELMPGWQLQAGYTHKVSRDQGGTKVSTWEPEDQINLYTSYKLTGDLDKLTLGGGVRWQSTGWQMLTNWNKGGTVEKFSQDPYWLVDLMARYQISKNLSATVNLNNVFDKSYYTNIGFYNSSYYGDPRNVMVTTRWDF